MLRQTPIKTLFDPPHRMLVEFPHPDLISRALVTFHRFLEKPQAEKDRWKLDSDDEGEPEYGYARRFKSDGKDGKQLVHYRKNTRAQLLAKGVVLTENDLEFLSACDALFKVCRATSRQHLTALARQYSTKHKDSGTFEHRLAHLLREADHQCQPMCRFMQYDGDTEPGTVIAKRHGDKGVTTVHAYASEPGLEFGEDHENLSDFEPVTIPTGSALIFPGRKMPTLTKGQIPALLHQVRATTRDKRDTIVYFDHAACNPIRRWYSH